VNNICLNLKASRKVRGAKHNIYTFMYRWYMAAWNVVAALKIKCI